MCCVSLGVRNKSMIAVRKRKKLTYQRTAAHWRLRPYHDQRCINVYNDRADTWILIDARCPVRPQKNVSLCERLTSMIYQELFQVPDNTLTEIQSELLLLQLTRIKAFDDSREASPSSLRMVQFRKHVVLRTVLPLDHSHRQLHDWPIVCCHCRRSVMSLCSREKGDVGLFIMIFTSPLQNGSLFHKLEEVRQT